MTDDKRFNYNATNQFFTAYNEYKLRTESGGAMQAGTEIAYWVGFRLTPPHRGVRAARRRRPGPPGVTCPPRHR